MLDDAAVFACLFVDTLLPKGLYDSYALSNEFSFCPSCTEFLLEPKLLVYILS